MSDKTAEMIVTDALYAEEPEFHPQSAVQFMKASRRATVATEALRAAGLLVTGEITEEQIGRAHEAFWRSSDITGGYEAIRAALPHLTEGLAEVIARAMPGWNDDISEPELEGSHRLAAEAHWERVNQACLAQANEYAAAVSAHLEKAIKG